jgi:hypothetical protein
MNINTLGIKAESVGVTRATRELDALGNSAEKTESKIKSFISSIDAMVAKFASSVSGTKAMTQSLSVVNSSTMASEAAIKALTTTIGGLSAQIAGMSANMGRSTTTITNNTTSVREHTAAMSDAHAAARGLSGSLGALWITYGNIAPLAAGAAIGASLKSIVTIGAEVENTLEAIRLKGEASISDINDLRKAILDIGQGVYGPQEVSKAFETLILAGLKAKDAVNAIGASLNLATAGGSTIEKTAEALVTIGTAVGATSAQYDYLADGITKAANISLASVDSIAEAVKRASVVNKLYGASFEDILTQTAALAQLGIKNTAAGTAITNFYANALGGTEKAKKALDALGFSFTDATGKAKPLVDAFEEFTAKLNNFDLKSQQKIITDIFGERALRDVEGLRDQVNSLADDTTKYTNKLRETQGQISEASGTASLVAAQQSLTTQKQFEATANTLKTTFLEAFAELDPVLSNITKKLKEIVSSADFKTTVQNIANAFANLAKVLVDNIGLLTAVAEGFIAVGAATAGGALFTKLIPLIGGAAIQMGLLSASTTAATIATTGLGRAITMLPGIGMVLGLATAAYALYSVHADKATSSTMKLAEESTKLAQDYNTDFLKALDEENTRLDKVNAQLAKGIDLTKAQTNATKDLALEKLKDKNSDAVSSAQKAVDEASKAVDPMKVITDYTYKQSEQYQKMIKAQALLNAAKEAQRATEDRISKAIDDNIKKSQLQQTMLKKQTEDADAAAKAAAGTQVFAGKDGSKAKGMNVFETLIDSQNKWIAGAKERQNSMQQFIDTGVDGETKFYTAEAKSTLASIAAEKAAKGLSAAEIERYKNIILLNAAKQDELKNNKQALEDYTSLKKSIQDQTAGLDAYLKSIVDGSSKVIGKYGEKVVASAASAKQTKEETEAELALAKALDEKLKLVDQIKKLEAKSNTLGAEAQALVAQAEAMSEYGKSAKSTSYELALATVAQLNFKDAAGQVVAANYLAEASFNTVVKALVNITKIGEQSASEQEKAEADSLLMFADSEKQKIQIKADSTKRIIQMHKDQALSAALATGDAKAWDTYYKVAEQSIITVEQIDNTTKTKMHNVELEDWKKTVNSIVDTGLAGFDTIFDKGTSIWKSLTNGIKDMFKKTVIDYIKKELAKPLLLNIVTSVAGSLGMTGIAEAAKSMLGSSSGAASSGNSAVSAASSASSVYSLLSKGFDGISTSVANAVQGGLDKLGLSMTSGANSTLATSIGTAAGAAAGIAAGYQLNKTISGQYKISNTVNTIENIATIAAAYSGPVASTVVGAVSGLLNRAFGMGNKEVTSQGIKGTLSDTSVSGVSYSNWKQDGGWFRSDKSGTDTSALSSDIQNTLITSFTALKATTSAFASNVDVSTAALDGFTKSFDIAFGSDATANAEAVTKFFTDLGDELATKLVPNIAEFALQGETASTTLQRLSETFTATNQIAAYLGKTVEATWGSVGLSSDAARERLISLAGGIDALSTKVATYASSFLTDAEKLAPVQKAVTAAMESLGLTGITTKEQFKGIVNSIDLTTVAGAELFNNLMDLAPSFAQAADASDALKAAQLELWTSNLDLQSQIAELEGNSAQSAAILAEQRRIELDSMDATLKPLQERLWALQDEAAASEAATAAAEEAMAAQEAAAKLWSSNLALQSTIAELEGNTAQSSAILAEQRRIEVAALDATLRPLQEKIYLLEDEKAATEAAAQAAADELAVQQAATKLWSDNLSLQMQVATLNNDQLQIAAVLAEQRRIEVAVLDATLRPLQERLYQLQDEAAATEKANKLWSDNLSLQSQVATLQGDSAQLAAVVAEQRRIEVAALDETLRPLQEKIYLLQDEKDAQEKANSLWNDSLSLQAQIAVLQDNTSQSAAVLAEQRRIELSALDDTLKPLQEKIYLLQDEKDAQEAANALWSSNLALQLQIATLTKDQSQINAIVAEQRRIELSALDDSLKPLQERLWMLQDEAAATELANTTQKTRLGMMTTIAEYNKDEAASAAILAEQRRLELEAMDSTLRPLQERINAIADEKAAYEKAVTTAEAAYTKLSDAVSRQKDVVTDSYAAQIKAVQDSTTAQLDFTNAQKDTATESLNAIKTVFDTITSAIKSTVVESATLDKYRRNAAQALVANAAVTAKSGGDVSKIAGLSDAIETLTQPSIQMFSTFEDYQFDQAQATDSLTSLQDSAQTQMDYAQLTIDRLDATITSIQTSGDNTVAQLEKERDERLAALDSSLELARNQLDALKGIDTSVLSVKDALAAFASSLTAIVSQPTASTSTSAATGAVASTDANASWINTLYNAYLGRDAEQAGIDYYSKLVNAGTLTIGQVANQIATSPEASSYLASFDVGTNEVPTDMIAQVHAGERIIPAADNAELIRRLDSGASTSEYSDMKQCFEELKEVITNGTVATNQKLSALNNVVKKWDLDGLPKERNYDLNA